MTSGTRTPVDTIGANAGSLNETDGVAFDSKANLWIANVGQNTVVEYTPTQLAPGGAPMPTVTIMLPTNADPFGLAFDNRGTLWVSDAKFGVLYGFTSAQLAAMGGTTPAVAAAVHAGAKGFSPEQPLFDPYATACGMSLARVRGQVATAARVRIPNRNHARYSRRLEPSER